MSNDASQKGIGKGKKDTYRTLRGIIVIIKGR